jgi:hypothetical protein
MKTQSLRKRLLGIKLKVGKKLSLFIWISRDVITTCRESLRMTALAQMDTLQRQLHLFHFLLKYFPKL